MRKDYSLSSINDHVEPRIGQGIMGIKGSGQGEERVAAGGYKMS